jgi:hypothetical protein
MINTRDTRRVYVERKGVVAGESTLSEHAERRASGEIAQTRAPVQIWSKVVFGAGSTHDSDPAATGLARR